MAAIKSPGLVLKKIPFSETSLILKVYTRESGLVTLIAKGAKRQKSRFSGVLDFFTENQFVYPEKSKSEILNLHEAALIRDFPRLKSDHSRQAVAHVFMELYLKYIHGPDQSVPLYELMLGHMERLEEVSAPNLDPVLELCDFLLSLCAVFGFSPQFSLCVQCGNKVDGFKVRLDAELGGPVCRNCAGDGAWVSLHGRILRWLNRLQDQGALAGRLPRPEEMQAEAFLLAFLGTHAGGTQHMKSLEFYRQMVGAG